MNSPSQKQAVELTDFKGLVVKSPGGTVIVEKLASFPLTWNGSAASAGAIESIDAPWSGISFMPFQGRYFMCGLASGAGAKAASIAGNQSYDSLMFATYFCGNTFHVYENGTEVGNFGNWSSGEHIEIAANAQGKIEYRVEGQVRYVSQQVIEYPVFVKICGHDPGDLLQDLCWLTRGPAISIPEQVSAGHRVLTDAGEKHACDLQSGDHVWVGSKKQQVLSVTIKKQRTNLYMVSFEPDGLVELFHVPSFGLQTFGEPAPSTHHGHAPESQCVSVCSDAEEESVCLNPSQLLHLIGCERVTEEDLQGSMPITYED